MEESLGLIVADVARLMRRAFDERARSIGVTRPQWQLLSVLARNEGCRQGSLADILEVEPITVCRMIDRLQDAGLIERRRDPEDRRSWRLYLTDRAVRLMEELRPLAAEMLAEACEGVDMAEQQALARVLDRMRQNLVRRPASAECAAEAAADHG